MATSVIDLLKKNEGFSGTIYNDTGGVPTIGYGFTAMVLDGKDGRPKFSDYKNKEMTKEEANDLLVNKIVPYFESQLRNKLDDYDSLADNQRAAIVDLAYRNGVAGLGKSGVYDAINKGDFEEATNIIRDSKDLQKENSVVLQPGDKAYKGITGRNTEAADVFSGVQTASPRTKSSSLEVDSESNAEDDLLAKRKEQKEKSYRLTADYILSPEEEKEVQDAAFETASDIQVRINKGELEGSDNEIKNIYYKELSEKLKLTNIDVKDADAVVKAKGFIKYATSISNEELGERIGGKQFVDSKIEDALENWTNNVNLNLKNLGILNEGPLTPTSSLSAPVAGLQLPTSDSKTIPFNVELKKIAEKDSKILAEMSKTGETASELADRKLAEQQTADNSLRKGIKRGEEIGEYSDIEEEEESMESLGLNEDGSQKPKKPKDSPESQEKMRKAEKVLSGLKAAAGILSLSKALRDPEIETPELSPLITEAVEKQRQLSKSGLTAAEKSAAMSNLDNAYAGAMKNVLRASGGQRGMFLAGQGVVDANRIQGLNQLAAQDAAVRQQNVQQYNALASSVGQMQLQRDMSVEQMKQATMQKNRDVLGGIGTNLVSDAISDVSWYLNPNRDLIEQAQRTNLEGLAGSDRVPYDASKSASVGLASTNPNIKSTEQEKQLQKQKNKTK
tara:strand:+ start:5713 stop:7740 length:2028 start_codon:yes stop_codon:yes gene_type:complete